MDIFLNTTQNFLSFFLICFIVLTTFIIFVQKKPVYAVFVFILTALSTFCFLCINGAEFLSLLILIIYTGVITVLFLFVVIMYNLRQINLNIAIRQFVDSDPLLVLFTYKVFGILWIHTRIFKMSIYQFFIINNLEIYPLDVIHFVTLFNKHYILFFFSGLLLLVAIIGSVVITYPFYQQYSI